MRRLTHILVALVGALSLLVLSAAPSSATMGWVNWGTANISLTPGVSIDLSGGSPCLYWSTTLNVTTSGASSPYSGTAHLDIGNASFAYGGATYFLDLEAMGWSASVSSTWPWGTMTTGNMAPYFTGNIYPEASPGSCTPGSAAMCVGVRFSSVSPLSLSGPFSGSVSPPMLGGTATLSGSGEIQAYGCRAPFWALNGSTIDISNLEVSF